MDDYERRFRAAASELKAAGVWQSNAIPPITHVLRKLGFRPKPPHFDKFWTIATAMGVWFGLFWGIAMYLILWRDQGMPIALVLLLSLIAGLFFGVLMAIYYGRGKKRHKLSAWKDL